jgi:hypothetical protein
MVVSRHASIVMQDVVLYSKQKQKTTHNADHDFMTRATQKMTSGSH